MRGWTDCPRCRGTGSGEDGGGCGYAPTMAKWRDIKRSKDDPERAARVEERVKQELGGLEARAVDGQFVAEPVTEERPAASGWRPGTTVVSPSGHLIELNARSAYPEEMVVRAKQELPELPPCPYGSDELHERGRILAAHHWDTPWEMTGFHGAREVWLDGSVGDRGVRAVLVSGGIDDYSVYLGAGSVEWVRHHGAKLSFEVAKAVFPRIDERRYRH